MSIGSAIGSSIGPAIGSALAGGGVAAWSPLSLFAAGEKGVWFDPSDFSTMWQDTAGTTPVTAVGQSVARIDDKSGNGKHATQSTPGKRPILQSSGGLYYLDFDGTDDALATAAIDFTATDKMTVVAGVTKDADAGEANIFCFGSSGALDGTFSLKGPGSASDNYAIATRGTSGVSNLVTGYAAPTTNVVTGAANISAQSQSIRVDADLSTFSASIGTGNFSSQIGYVGARGTTAYLNGRIYQLIVRGAETVDVTDVEAYVATKTGVTL